MPKPPRAGPKAQKPHDAIVKWTFSQREHAIGLLKAALPRAVVQAVDWRTVKVEKDSFVDEALTSRYSDLVFSARMDKSRVYFYTLVEHQRDVEALMVLRILQYMTRLWEQLVLDDPNAKTLPPILPLLIHNSATGWTAATAFQDIIEGDGPERAALDRHIPHFEVRLIDVSEGQASYLVGQSLTALGKVVLWCLSCAWDDERLVREIGRLAKALDEILQSPNGRAALKVILRYLAATHAQMRAERIGELLMKATGPKGQEVIVTFLDQIKLEGKRIGERIGERRGERRGELQGRVKALLEQLAAKFGRVPDDAKARIQAADEATVARWTLRVLTAPTLEEVLAPDGDTAPPPAAPRRAAPRKRSRKA